MDNFFERLRQTDLKRKALELGAGAQRLLGLQNVQGNNPIQRVQSGFSSFRQNLPETFARPFPRALERPVASFFRSNQYSQGEEDRKAREVLDKFLSQRRDVSPQRGQELLGAKPFGATPSLQSPAESELYKKLLMSRAGSSGSFLASGLVGGGGVKEPVEATGAKLLKGLKVPTPPEIASSVLSLVKGGKKYYTELTPTQLATLKDEVKNIPFTKEAPLHLDAFTSNLASQATKLSLPDFASLHPNATKVIENISRPLKAPVPPAFTYSGSEDYLQMLKGAQKEAKTVEKGSLSDRTGDFLSDVKRKLVDSTAPIEDILAKSIKGGVDVPITEHISPQIDRAIRARELASQFIKDNGFADVVRNAPDLHALDQYLIARHAPEVATKTGRNALADAQLVKELAPIYEPLAQKTVQYGQKLLDYVTESGLVSTETANLLKKKYPNYVPLNRIFNEIEKIGVPEGASGRGVASLSKQSVVRKLVGSERAIASPLESLTTKTIDAFAQGERNIAGKMLASYETLPGNPFQMRELGKGQSAVHTFSFLDNGVKRTFETTPEVVQAAKFLDKRQLGLVGQIFALPVRVAKVGITGLNIPFVVSNIARDQVTAFINSDRALSTSIANPGVFLKSLWTALGHGAEYDNWVRAAGGGTSFDIARSAPEVSLERIRAGKDVGSKIKYTAKHPSELLRAIEDVVGRSEELTRLQQFIGTREGRLGEGSSLQEATLYGAKASRENTVNFGRSGDWGQALNAAFLYINAGIQGSRTLVRNLQTRPVQTASKIGMSVLFPLTTLTAWNMSDPKRKEAYDDIREFEKENNLVIVPPNPTKDPLTGKWNVIKIPFSQEISGLTIPVRKSIEAVHGADGPSFKDLVAALVGTTTSLDTQSPEALLGQFIPQAVKPPIEAVLNKNLFTNTDIVPQYLGGKLSKTLPASQQVEPDTSGSARLIGGAVGISPMKVEQFAKSAFGGVGSQLINTSDNILAKLGVIPPEQIGGQSIREGLSSRFTEARGGEDLTSLYEQVDKANNTRTKLPPVKPVFNNGKVYYPTIVNHRDGTRSYSVKSEAVKDSPFNVEDLGGVSAIDKALESKSASDGSRARAMDAILKKMRNSQERKTQINTWAQMGLVDDNVYAQLVQLVRESK